MIPTDGKVLITIQATITYTITEDGKDVTREFLYTVNLYPEPSNAWDKDGNLKSEFEGVNECKWWYNDGGFDYTIKANAIEELVKQNIETTYSRQLSVELGHPERSPVPTTTPGTIPEPTPGTPGETPEPTPGTTPAPGGTPEPTPGTPGTTPGSEVTPTPGTPGETPEPTLGTPGTTPTPEVTPTPGTPGETPEPTPGTPEEPPTPEVTPVPPVPGNNVPPEPPTPQGTVLGARRVQMNARDAAVLGVRRGVESAVLGKRRRPSTGDSTAMFVWIIVLSIAIGGALSSGVFLVAGRNKKTVIYHKTGM